MSKFKIGDRVRCISHTDPYTRDTGCIIGEVYTVSILRPRRSEIAVKENERFYISVRDFKIYKPIPKIENPEQERLFLEL